MEGYPLRLLVIVTIMAVAMPILYGAFAVYDQGGVTRQLGASIDRLSYAAQTAYTGPGTRLTISFLVPEGFTTTVDWVRIGDVPNGTDSSIIRFQIAGGSPGAYVVEDPNVPMMGPFNRSLELVPGEHRLRVEGLVRGDGAFVRITKVA